MANLLVVLRPSTGAYSGLGCNSSEYSAGERCVPRFGCTRLFRCNDEQPLREHDQQPTIAACRAC